jgi:hypothetical protein
MSSQEEIRWERILLLFNIFLTVVAISANYQVAKYSLQGDMGSCTINSFANSFFWGKFFFGFSVIALAFGFFWPGRSVYKKCEWIAIGLAVCGAIVSVILPYFWNFC